MTTTRPDITILSVCPPKQGQARSEVIRDATTCLVDEEEKQPSAYDRLQPFIGIVDSGDPKLSEGTGKRLQEILEDR